MIKYHLNLRTAPQSNISELSLSRTLRLLNQNLTTLAHNISIKKLRKLWVGFLRSSEKRQRTKHSVWWCRQSSMRWILDFQLRMVRICHCSLTADDWNHTFWTSNEPKESFTIRQSRQLKRKKESLILIDRFSFTQISLIERFICSELMKEDRYWSTSKEKIILWRSSEKYLPI